ncbi:flagellar assembly peptidoglycan hydrolase FlgJ [Marinomonas spartinae]|uniref:flagellar assembly peptidoglycan hydrolase FlgJ n=1 Tax=Marinomonas spartinae TaxID=1792290 RepID=UPI0018F1AEBC|nr:flagellar assembly peptidoglycan hydrolase FlgJ [Marinomonas spartinae]MBJ7552780.1 flagellar assembly peptidoglycan hydrolase FlgJ [Marinomonas spartinae]
MNALPPTNPDDFFADFSALESLKTKAKKDPEAALKEVSQKFEAIFIGMLLKNMRAGNEALGDGLFSSQQTKQYQGMMDDQMAQVLAKTGGFGVSEALIRQYQAQHPKAHKAGASDDNDFIKRVSSQDLVRVKALAHQASTDFLKAAQKEMSGATVEASSSSTSPKEPVASHPDLVQSKEEAAKPTAQSVAFDSPEAFVKAMWPHAKAVAEKLGVSAKAILAQAVLETGWGKHPIAKDDGTASYNLFGIKADHRWDGDRAVVNTLEFRHGIAKREKAAFRAYDSFSQSFNDYANFLTADDRYKDALKSGNDPSLFAVSLQKGGYATDPEYAQKIDRILSSKWFEAL